MARKPEPREASAAATGVTVIGAPPVSLRDVYHLFLRTSWPVALGAIVLAWLAINAVFADLYLTVGGVASMRQRSFWDAFCFSVQTMGTIGYGSMYPTTVAANAIMIAESVTSLIVTAVATGMLFAKFSRIHLARGLLGSDRHRAHERRADAHAARRQRSAATRSSRRWCASPTRAPSV